ncbi:hypothetical protein HK101_000988 [Irineochytrium annulatum]|nr:hypothetical protein HK101_000988 [Irineochytrium annulatum]
MLPLPITIVLVLGVLVGLPAHVRSQSETSPAVTAAFNSASPCILSCAAQANPPLTAENVCQGGFSQLTTKVDTCVQNGCSFNDFDSMITLQGQLQQICFAFIMGGGLTPSPISVPVPPNSVPASPSTTVATPSPASPTINPAASSPSANPTLSGVSSTSATTSGIAAPIATVDSKPSSASTASWVIPVVAGCALLVLIAIGVTLYYFLVVRKRRGLADAKPDAYDTNYNNAPSMQYTTPYASQQTTFYPTMDPPHQAQYGSGPELPDLTYPEQGTSMFMHPQHPSASPFSGGEKKQPGMEASPPPLFEKLPLQSAPNNNVSSDGMSSSGGSGSMRKAGFNPQPSTESSGSSMLKDGWAKGATAGGDYSRIEGETAPPVYNSMAAPPSSGDGASMFGGGTGASMFGGGSSQMAGNSALPGYNSTATPPSSGTGAAGASMWGSTRP